MGRHKLYFASACRLWAFLVVLQLFLSPTPTWGLDPDKTIEQYLVDQWEMADGIPSNEILSIAQTPEGYLWIATSKGLVKFDGMKFSISPLAEKEKIDPLKTITLEALFVDRAGTLWIGSSVGLTSYNYQTGQFKTYTSSDGLTQDRIRRIKDDMKGNLWISLWSSYVNRLSNGEFFAFNASHGLEGKKIDAIFEDRKGNLLFGSRENGVFIYKDGKFSRYPIAGLDKILIITTMQEDRKGDLWIGTDNGLFRVNNKETVRYTASDGLTSKFITTIMEDSDRNLWVGTTKGLNRINRKQDGSVGFESLLRPFVIYSLFEDREKSLWVGTYESGIKRLKNGKFISYAPFETLQDAMIVSVFESRNGETWIGTFTGKLYQCRGSKIIKSIEPPELSGTVIAAIAEDANGNLWLGTSGKGVFQKKGVTPLPQKDEFFQYTIQVGLSDNTVTSIYRDSRNNLWFSTFDGVSILRSPDGVIETFTTRNGLSGKTVHNVYEDKERNIWIAADKGITVLKEGKMTKENMAYYLKGVSVPCIYEDPSASDDQSKIYWIATYGEGLKRLKLKNGANSTVISYTTAAGMTTNCLYQFFEDQQENFWIMSDSGILRINKSELNHFASGEEDFINCISYGVSDGMKSPEFNNEFSRHSAFRTRNGELWFITKKGISIVDPEKIRINKISPPVVIETAFFDGQSIPMRQDPEVYKFKGIRNFRFHFTAPTFLSPEKIKFKYQLEGFDKEWVFLPPGSGRVAHYWNLEPGTYTFKVMACNAEGIWNRTGDSITFTLNPFIYQTLVFKIVLLLLFAAFLTAAVYIYKKRPFDKKKKPKVSSLSPHFVKEKIKKLNSLMENEKVYRIANVSLESLAKKLDIPPYQLSLILNETLNQRFPDFINSYRIEEAKEILVSPRGANIKNTALAYEVGFNSITAFYKTFQKFTHMTPNQYKKEVKKKK